MARAQQPPFTIMTSVGHVRAFAPPARADRFEFGVTPESIETVARFYRDRWPSDDAGSWAIAPGPAVEAFDSAAVFDRAKLARLYGGRSARIARGPIDRDGTGAVVMLMSPYPEADLGRLNQGTLVMEVRIAPVRDADAPGRGPRTVP